MKNPFNDEAYTGNDEQIDDLKTYGGACTGVLRSLYDHFGEAVEKDEPISGADAVEVIGRGMPIIKALLKQAGEI